MISTVMVWMGLAPAEDAEKYVKISYFNEDTCTALTNMGCDTCNPKFDQLDVCIDGQNENKIVTMTDTQIITTYYSDMFDTCDTPT